jgi:hypothetical protein
MPPIPLTPSQPPPPVAPNRIANRPINSPELGGRLAGAASASPSPSSGGSRGQGIIPNAPSPPLSTIPVATPRRGVKSRYRELDPESQGVQMPPMPPPPSQESFPPISPPPVPDTSAKRSRMRELRKSLRPGKRSPPPPSPSIYPDEQGATSPSFEPVARNPALSSEKSMEETKSGRRKTLFQRAIEGWWDLPGLLSRGDTIRGKKKPFVSSRNDAHKGMDDASTFV